MRDDVLGLGFLKSPDFVARPPIPTRSTALDRANTSASFAAQLNRATLKKYSSPLAGPRNAPAQTTQQRRNLTTQPAKPSPAASVKPSTTRRAQTGQSSLAQRATQTKPATTTPPRSTLTSPQTSLEPPT